MPVNQIIIGSKDFPISKITLLLKTSQSFHIFHDNWTLIANDLETRRDLVKTLQKDYLIKTIGLVDIINGLLEEWVARKSGEASLQELERILEENGMKECADTLKEATVVNFASTNLTSGTTDKDESTKVKKFLQVPTALRSFLDAKTSKFCILHTMDIRITCDKIKENVDDCYLYEWKKFIKIISSPGRLHSRSVNIVVDCTLKNLKKFSKARFDEDSKIVFVTCEHGERLKEVIEKSPSWEILADDMNWVDLSLAHQLEITEQLEETHGIEFDDLELDGQLLVDLINGKEVKLFKDTIPDELSYYIERSLLTRNYISLKVFEKAKSRPDIFLFTGLERYELSILAKEKLTGISSKQIRQAEVTIKYMILDEPTHFDKICNICSYPVHFLHYENGRLRWIQSKGNINFLQRFISKDQDELNEDNFLSTLNSYKNRAIVISDSPGMGKSVLLAQMGRRLCHIQVNRSVFFVVLGEFVRTVKELMEETHEEERSALIKKSLKGFLCENVVGEEVLNYRLISEEIKIELLLDGFDEVNSAHIKLVYEILQTLTSFKSIRIWISSRPHLLKKLETKLHVLGFKIQPFSEAHQIKFLISYWALDAPLNKSRLEDFAIKCLQNLKLCMKFSDEGIAGIALQCLMIGQVYAEEAAAYAKSEQTLFPEILISSITDLYKLLVEKKVEKYIAIHLKGKNSGSGTVEAEAIMHMHVRLSLELIFPEYLNLYLDELIIPVEMDKVLQVGILESSDPNKTVKFMHRTFAEYFIAWIMVDKLGRADEWNEVLLVMLCKGLLLHNFNDIDNSGLEFIEHDVLDDNDRENNRSCNDHTGDDFSEDENDINYDDDEYYEDYDFEIPYPLVCYFFNSMITDAKPMISSHTTKLITDAKNASNKITELVAFQMSVVCASKNYINILKYFERLRLFDQYASTIFDENFLAIAITYSDLELVKLGFKYFEQHNKFNVKSMQIRMLRLAIEMGKFSIVEFLLKEKELLGLVTDLKNGAKWLLHSCVSGFCYKSKVPKIEERIQIMRMLVSINRELLEEKDPNGATPLISNQVPVELLIELFRLGANVLPQEECGNTILQIGSYLSAEDYHLFLTKIPKDSLRKLVQLKGIFQHPPLMSLVRTNDLLEETFTLFKNAGADFNYTDTEGSTPLTLSIASGKKSDTLQKLARQGADIFWKDSKYGNTLLHVAARVGNGEVVRFLVNERMIDVNSKNYDKKTPLDWLEQRITWSNNDSNLFGKKDWECINILKELGGENSSHEETSSSVSKLLPQRTADDSTDQFKH